MRCERNRVHNGARRRGKELARVNTLGFYPTEELALDIARSLVHDHSYLYVLEEAYNNDLDADQVVDALRRVEVTL